MAKRKQNSTSGLVGYYNAHQKSGAYNTPNYWANYDPSQGFGTPKPVGPRAPDAAEQLATTTANRNVNLSDANAIYQTGQINRDFGYNAQGGIDPNNPYSRAALLEQNFKNSQRGDLNSYAGQGQLYSGAYQNQINERTRQHSQDSNQLKNSYSDALHGVTLGQLQTYANSGTAVSDSSYQALLRQLGLA